MTGRLLSASRSASRAPCRWLLPAARTAP